MVVAVVAVDAEIASVDAPVPALPPTASPPAEGGAGGGVLAESEPKPN